jgi:hypothetical protein
LRGGVGSDTRFGLSLQGGVRGGALVRGLQRFLFCCFARARGGLRARLGLAARFGLFACLCLGLHAPRRFGGERGLGFSAFLRERCKLAFGFGSRLRGRGSLGFGTLAAAQRLVCAGFGFGALARGLL